MTGGESTHSNEFFPPTARFMEGKSVICPDPSLRFRSVLIFSHLSLFLNLDEKEYFILKSVLKIIFETVTVNQVFVNLRTRL